MQKFGLDDLLDRGAIGIEWEIMEEHASALGRSGRELQNALDHYYALSHPTDAHLQAISDAVWQLILQREFIGFMHDNLEWVQRSYDIPKAALKHMGRNRSSN